MNFSAYSIKNPIVAILFFTLLTIAGIIGFQKMKIEQFPQAEFPAVIATVMVPGSAPEQMENEVAKKVENKIANLEGIKRIQTTLQTGATTVSVEFVLEKDPQEALDEVRSAMNEIKGELPADAEDPIVSKFDLNAIPIQTYSISSSKMSESELSWYVDNDIDKRLSKIKGVGNISRIGGIERIVTVEPDPNRLNALQMNIGQLSQQVSALQRDASGGASKIGGHTQTIRVMGAVNNADELADLQVMTPIGSSEYLSNLAIITDGDDEAHSIAKLDDKTVVAFNVVRTKDANTVELSKAVQASLAELQKKDPSLTITKVYDTVQSTEDNYHDSMNMLIEGGILAVIVVFLFLMNWRATIVASIALPLSIIPAFFVMWQLDFSLNMISLLALSLVVGVLVDDAIVEIENIVRHLRMGKTPMQASLEAADEIGLAVVATTFTLIAVFLPTAFMSGVVGKYFRQFGLTASVAIFMSLLVARLLTPMMSAYILKPEKHKEEKDGRIMKAYLTFVSWAIRLRWLTLGLVIALFVGSVMLAKTIPAEFIPANNINQTKVNIELTPDANLEDTTKVAEQAYNAIKDIDGIESVMSAIGQAQSRSGRSHSSSEVNKASFDIVLAPRDKRPSKTEIEEKITQALQEIPSARFEVGLSSGGGSGYEFQLSASSPRLLNETVQNVMNDIRQIDKVTSVTSNRSLPKPELKVIPDPLAMADKGVNTLQIANTLRVATSGDFEQNLSKLNLDARQLPIIVRLPKYAREDVHQLENLYIKKGVRIGDVAQLVFSNGPSQIKRYNRERSIKITVQSSNLGVVKKKIHLLSSIKNLPDSMSFTETGEAESQKELFQGFGMAMLVGVFCIFGVLILLFHRILQPFTILMALPLSMGGAFVSLILTKSSLSLPSLIGLVMLIGIATKNSILLVDYAIIAQNKLGMRRNDALIDACHKRVRPIIMTSIAMGAGMLPLLFGWGGADPSFRRPMAAAVVGGLATSTILSLVVIPVVYTIMDDLSNLFKKQQPEEIHQLL
ncbi:MAG: efflux RND transporter permease subunit [Moraxellaceae bacterium]|nr:efflux RND transporter permease subunit [Moraxellaceae bacterium]